MDPISITTDATYTYRGYRLQALYILWRILNSSDSESLVFQPEGVEDLAIYDDKDNIIEVAQVKAYDRNLTLSSFSPHKRASFFYRVADYITAVPEVIVKLISFGQFGDGLEKLHADELNSINALSQKLSSYGYVSEDTAYTLFSRIHSVTVDEHTLRENLQTMLGSILTAGDPQSAFELLSFWIYICSENKTKITRVDVVNKINQVGRFINERAAFHQEWFTNIVPISDALKDGVTHNTLADEFYNGMSARYEHILAGIDVIRPEKIQEIRDGFGLRNVVIVHGASGQGKSTLGYRFLHECFPSEWRFQVRTVQDRKHALTIATAISSHARAIGIPLLVYIDVSPSDLDWPLLVRELSSQPNIQVLVTIREEDFKRANISGTEFMYASIDLSFNAEEAAAIFEALVVQRPSISFLNFDEAWNRFGGEGPLMEFVYLVTQNQSLHERLQQQINRFRDEGRRIAGNSPQTVLGLLRLVAVVTSTSARLEARTLATLVGLVDPERVFELLENEYLLKRSVEGVLIESLHPIRSRKIAQLLTGNLSPWPECAVNALPVVYEADLQAFLLDSFVNHATELVPLLKFLETHQTKSWCGLAGVVRALLWLGVKEYYLENQSLIDEVYEQFGDGGAYLIDFDVANVSPDAVDAAWKTLEIMGASEDIRTRRDEFMSRQTDKSRVVSRVRSWLTSRITKPSIAGSVTDWAGLAEVLFWVGRLEIPWPLEQWLSDINLDEVVQTLPLDVLGDVVLGLSHGYQPAFVILEKNYRPTIATRFKQDTHTIVLEDDGNKLTAHFIIDMFADQTASETKPLQVTSENRLHGEAIWRIELLAKLYPDRHVFACQGYGHKLLGLDLPFDDTYKSGVDRDKLPQWWLTWLNSAFRTMTRFPHRPAIWPQYAELILFLRERVCQTLEQYEFRLNGYFRKKGFVPITELITDALKPDLLRMLNNPPLLPKCAVDELGFADESSSKTAITVQEGFLPRSVSIQPYKPLLDVFKKYTSSLSTFFQQSQHAIVLNPVLGRQAKTEAQKASVTQKAVETNINPKLVQLSVWNFADVVQVLPDFQKQFRSLLAQYVDTDRLNTLEHQEHSLFVRVWSMWYFFAFYPEEVQHKPSEIFPRRVRAVGQQLRYNLNRTLKQRSKESLDFRLLDEDCSWEHEPVLCVIVDGTDAIEVYNAVETLVASIRATHTKFEDTRLRDYGIDFSWSFLVIVPLVRGMLLNELAWKIPFYLFRSNDEIKWWYYVPHRIPADMMAKLFESHLEFFNHPCKSDADSLRQNIIELRTLVAHIRDFINLPEEGQGDRNSLQHYVDQMATRINNTLQAALDGIATMLNEVHTEGGFPDLIPPLADLHKNVRPGEDTGDTFNLRLRLEDMTQWLESLSQANSVALEVYLKLATYLIDKAREDITSQ